MLDIHSRGIAHIDPRWLILVLISVTLSGILWLTLIPSDPGSRSFLSQTATDHKWNITVCTMLRNVFPYALEWIEFHRIQGVDHFVLYDDDSQDDIVLLSLLYLSINADDIEVVPANFLRSNRQSDHGSKDHDHNQRATLRHCHARYKSRSKWMLIIDADEFIYSPRHKTVAEFLRLYDNYTQPQAYRDTFVSEFRIQAVRYGTSGLQGDFQAEVSLDARDGEIVIVHEAAAAHRPEPRLILEANPRRAPHPDLDGSDNYERLFDATCLSDPVGRVKCQHAIGKYLFQPERCQTPYIHWCLNLSGDSIELPLAELRVDHFAWRSAESVSQLTANWQGNKVAVFAQFDRTWFSRMADVSNKRFIDDVRNGLSRFRWRSVERKQRLRPRPKWLLDQMEALGRNLTFALFQ